MTVLLIIGILAGLAAAALVLFFAWLGFVASTYGH
jgi:hypothetical protein